MPGLIDPAQALRLLRELWPNATMLAQELYSILTSTANQPLSIPLQLGNLPGGQAPLQLLGVKPGDTLIKMTGPGGEDAGSFVFTTGGLTFVPPGQTADGGGTLVADGGGNVFFGKVISGTANTYQVDVYTTGRGRPAVRQTVRQVQIDAGETIPANTWALVVKEPDGTWSMQVPVWL